MSEKEVLVTLLSPEKSGLASVAFVDTVCAHWGGSGVTGTQLVPMSANRVVSNVGVDLIQPHFKNQS